MEKIRLKLNIVELEWLICVVRSLKMTDETASMMVLEAVRQIGNRLVILWVNRKNSNSLTLSFAEGYILLAVVESVDVKNHEAAWQLSIQTQIEKAADGLKTKKLASIEVQ